MKIQGSKGNAYANRLGTNPKFSRKRYVFIHLAYNDTYKIKIVNPRTFKTDAEVSDIYADELSYILETLWETEETLKAWEKNNKSSANFSKVN